MPQVSLGPRRRAWLLVAGQLAMLVCAMAFSLVHLGADARVPALAAARPLAAGQTITVDDLQVVRIVPDAGMALLPAGEASRVVGSSVAVPVAAGTLLSEAQLGPAQWPPEGQAVAALPFKPGRLPAGLAAGSA
jgi:flagella basal body P-ring formation protein FlgA